jgi:hypothetical protein
LGQFFSQVIVFDEKMFLAIFSQTHPVTLQTNWATQHSSEGCRKSVPVNTVSLSQYSLQLFLLAWLAFPGSGRRISSM